MTDDEERADLVGLADVLRDEIEDEDEDESILDIPPIVTRAELPGLLAHLRRDDDDDERVCSCPLEPWEHVEQPECPAHSCTEGSTPCLRCRLDKLAGVTPNPDADLIDEDPTDDAGAADDVLDEDPPPDDDAEEDPAFADLSRQYDMGYADGRRAAEQEVSDLRAELAEVTTQWETLEETCKRVTAQRDQLVDDLTSMTDQANALEATLADERQTRAAQVYALNQEVVIAQQRAYDAIAEADHRAREAEKTSAAMVREAQERAKQAEDNAERHAAHIIDAERKAISQAVMWEVIVGKQRVYVAAATIDRAIAAARKAHPDQPIGGAHAQNIKVLVG